MKFSFLTELRKIDKLINQGKLSKDSIQKAIGLGYTQSKRQDVAGLLKRTRNISKKLGVPISHDLDDPGSGRYDRSDNTIHMPSRKKFAKGTDGSLKYAMVLNHEMDEALLNKKARDLFSKMPRKYRSRLNYIFADDIATELSNLTKNRKPSLLLQNRAKKISDILYDQNALANRVDWYVGKGHYTGVLPLEKKRTDSFITKHGGSIKSIYGFDRTRSEKDQANYTGSFKKALLRRAKKIDNVMKHTLDVSKKKHPEYFTYDITKKGLSYLKKNK